MANKPMATHSNPALAVIATHRFSLGPKPGELLAAHTNPKAWLKAQLRLPFIVSTHRLPSSSELIKTYYQFRNTKKQLEKAEASGKKLVDQVQLEMFINANKPAQHMSHFVNDSLNTVATADNGLAWRLFDFFSNHFSVSASGGAMKLLAPTLEREAIAPHLFGKFEDMLLAVESHPAMLVYLNNEKSFGPNSKAGLKSQQRKNKRGLNENLAREILELHTLGVNGGYTQQDVAELAKTITGWSVHSAKDNSAAPGFLFRKYAHEPGTRTILGKTYTAVGVEQGKAVLQHLATHPATAKHLAEKLARHFVSDSPPSTLIAKLEAAWLTSQGNISHVMHTLIDSDEAWQPQKQKLKSPREFIISACRASGFTKWKKHQAINALAELGQRPFNAGSPAGFGDTATAWNGADALRAKIEFSAQAAKRINTPAKTLIEQGFGNTLSPLSQHTILRAESQAQARALFFLTPEFIRR